MNLSPEEVERAENLRHSPANDKVDFVKVLIEELKWTDANIRHIGPLWGESPSGMARYERQAESLIFAKITDPEELKAKLISQIHFVVQDAMQKKKAFVDKEGNILMAPDVDHKSALAGIGQIAKMSGIDKGVAPTKSPQQYSQYSLDELLEIAHKKILPAPTPTLTTEVQTSGETIDEEKTEATKTTVSNRD